MFLTSFYFPSLQEALHIFPKMTADPLESGAVKVHLGGEGYNRKTLNRVKRSIPKQQVRMSMAVTSHLLLALTEVLTAAFDLGLYFPE